MKNPLQYLGPRSPMGEGPGVIAALTAIILFGVITVPLLFSFARFWWNFWL